MGAGTVLAMLDRDRYEVVPAGILPDGRWVLTRDEPERLAISGRTLPSVAALAGPAAGAAAAEGAAGEAEAKDAEAGDAAAGDAAAGAGTALAAAASTAVASVPHVL